MDQIKLHTFSALAIESSAIILFAVVSVWILLTHIMDYYVIKGGDRFTQKRWLFWSLLVLGQALCLLIGEPSNQFIYFQF